MSERNRGRQKGSETEMESRRLLNVDLWVLNSLGLWLLPCRRDAEYHRFWLTEREREGQREREGEIQRISKTELNTPRGYRGTDEITSELVKWP